MVAGTGRTKGCRSDELTRRVPRRAAQLRERSGLSRYEVEVAMGAATAPDEGSGPGAWASSAVAPGMPVEVHLRTGRRLPLSYLGKPLTDFFSRSLREE